MKIRRWPANDIATGRHLDYLQRDAVAPDGSPGRLYDAKAEDIEDRDFLNRCRQDRRQYRLTLAAEDAADLHDLKLFTRAFMATVERDLGAELDWVAADHFDTGHPHSHILLRDCDRNGEPLQILGGYLHHGLRERAAEIITAMLGPDERSDLDQKLQVDVENPGWTFLDETLISRSEHGLLDPAARPGGDLGTERLRLRQLQRMGLVEMLPKGVWQIRPGMIATLQRLSQQRRRMAILSEIASFQGRALVSGRCNVMAFDQVQKRALTGAVAATGREEGRGGAYLIFDTTQGDLTYVHGIPNGVAAELRPGSIVNITPGRLRILSRWPLHRLIHYPGRTWLDDLLQGHGGSIPEVSPALAEGVGAPQANADFGLQLRAALTDRREFLVDLGLIDTHQPDAIPRDLTARLNQVSLARLGIALKRKPLAFPGHHIAGLRGRLLGVADTPDGPLAILGNQSRFALAPLSQVKLLGRGLAQAIFPR